MTSHRIKRGNAAVGPGIVIAIGVMLLGNAALIGLTKENGNPLPLAFWGLLLGSLAIVALGLRWFIARVTKIGSQIDVDANGLTWHRSGTAERIGWDRLRWSELINSITNKVEHVDPAQVSYEIGGADCLFTVWIDNVPTEFKATLFEDGAGLLASLRQHGGHLVEQKLAAALSSTTPTSWGDLALDADGVSMLKERVTFENMKFGELLLFEGTTLVNERNSGFTQPTVALVRMRTPHYPELVAALEARVRQGGSQRITSTS